ncbi:MAG: hypothetical protein JWP06_722 [Candidatus Saccharibacteria bacterium]|nr:hypothetical protein [Candidatus Saccharibacteria bacterium]
MTEKFTEMLAVGGHANSLGQVNDVIELVLNDQNRLDELYSCLFNEDAWIRMRAADALEKICRQHPDWLVPYIDKFSNELATSTQPSIRWHLAQIYREVELTTEQKHFAINWLKDLLSTEDVDWIVAANAMDTLAHFTKDGSYPVVDITPLLKIQQKHKSNAVIKRANKLLAELSGD